MPKLTEKKNIPQLLVIIERNDRVSGRLVIPKYIAWEKMNQLEKNRIRKNWDEYYKQFRQGRPIEIFQEMRKACKFGNSAKIRELRDEIRELLLEGNFAKQPDFVDPKVFDYDSSLQNWRELKSKQEFSQTVIDSIF